MKYSIFFLLAVLSLHSTALMSECFKCEEIKEKNKKLPPLKHEYYDDYLQELRAEGKSFPKEIDFNEGELKEGEKKE